MPATYEPISTTTLGSAAASIDFTSITSSYTDLVLVLTGTTASNGDTIYLQFNGDTATNYSRTELYGNGTTVTSSRVTGSNAAFIGDSSAYGTSSTIPGNWIVNIFSYAGSTNKTLLSRESMDKNGSGGTDSIVNLWRSTAAITSIKVRATGNLSSGFTATLYGILKA